MKKLICILLSVLLAFLLVSCAKTAAENEDTSDEFAITTASMEGDNSMTQEKPSTTDLPSVTNDAQRNEIVAHAWDTRAENILQATAITRVEYVIESIWEEPQIYSSEDSDLIARMKTWLSELRYTVIPYEGYFGSFRTTLTFYEGDTSLQLFKAHPTQNILVIEECATGRYNASWRMVRIDEKATGELISLLREMGVRQWDPVED